LDLNTSKNRNGELNILEAIIDSSYDGLWICDKEGRVVRINRASEKINGVKAGQVIGKRMGEIIAEGLIDQSVTLENLDYHDPEAQGWESNSCDRQPHI